jgi:hypothetical protein
MLGANFGQFSVVTTARLRGTDSRPRRSLNVERELYLRRLSLMTIHELSHDLINGASHHQEAAWVNARSGAETSLGPHCDDNSCAMYEVVDISAPPRDDGYLRLGNKCLYDAGLDEHLERLRADWFCPRCRDCIVIPELYRIGQPMHPPSARAISQSQKPDSCLFFLPSGRNASLRPSWLPALFPISIQRVSVTNPFPR